jgi:hypothetical protein
VLDWDSLHLDKAQALRMDLLLNDTISLPFSLSDKATKPVLAATMHPPTASLAGSGAIGRAQRFRSLHLHFSVKGVLAEAIPGLGRPLR